MWRCDDGAAATSLYNTTTVGVDTVHVCLDTCACLVKRLEDGLMMESIFTADEKPVS